MLDHQQQLGRVQRDNDDGDDDNGQGRPAAVRLDALMNQGVAGWLCILATTRELPAAAAAATTTTTTTTVKRRRLSKAIPSSTRATAEDRRLLRSRAKANLSSSVLALAEMNGLIFEPEFLSCELYTETAAKDDRSVVSDDVREQMDIEAEELEDKLIWSLERERERSTRSGAEANVFGGVPWAKALEGWCEGRPPDSSGSSSSGSGHLRPSALANVRIRDLVLGRRDCDANDIKAFMSCLAVWTLRHAQKAITSTRTQNQTRTQTRTRNPKCDRDRDRFSSRPLVWTMWEPIVGGTLETGEKEQQTVICTIRHWYETILAAYRSSRGDDDDDDDDDTSTPLISPHDPNPQHGKGAPSLPGHVIGVLKDSSSSSSSSEGSWITYDVDLAQETIQTFHGGPDAAMPTDAREALGKISRRLLGAFLSVLKGRRQGETSDQVACVPSPHPLIPLVEPISRYTGLIAVHLASTLCALYMHPSLFSELRAVQQVTADERKPTQSIENDAVGPGGQVKPCRAEAGHSSGLDVNVNVNVNVNDASTELDEVNLYRIGTQHVEAVKDLIDLERNFWQSCDEGSIKIIL